MNTKFVLENIKKRRKALGLTQKDVANELFMDERTYSKIERGCKKSIDLALIFELSRILDISIVALLKDEQTASVEEEASKETMMNIMFNMMNRMSEQQQLLAQELKLMQSKLRTDLSPIAVNKRISLDPKN